MYYSQPIRLQTFFRLSDNVEYIFFMLPDSELKQNSGVLRYFSHNLTLKL